ncbi:hypothetical protein M5689_002306 [Euphorbia peplus]|nr:hypothetical protein M5689_002306 [Euphorbia peplus]
MPITTVAGHFRRQTPQIHRISHSQPIILPQLLHIVLNPDADENLRSGSGESPSEIEECTGNRGSGKEASVGDAELKSGDWIVDEAAEIRASFDVVVG